MKYFKHILKTIALMAIVFGCSKNAEPSQDKENLDLSSLKDEIEQIINSEDCSEASTCEFIAFGSKPCGGAWSYLVYSSNIDVELLKQKVSIYNKLESEYNIKWNVISDCMAVSPPSNVACINGKCTAVF
tara:strand:+ start:851 stop:1240 length:390 start_codon:yes stop_codon:yes gene_type:complete